MTSTKTYQAAIVIIGNEILSGRTQDANLAYIAKGLAASGIFLAEARVIPDIESVIIDTINSLRQRYDYIFTTGGIGPTHDDITALAVAKAFGVTLTRSPAAVKLLASYYQDATLNEARLKMADIPAGARLIDNPISGAPGFQIGNVYVLAGVPAIARAMFDGIQSSLVGGRPVVSRSVAVFLGESEIAAALSQIQDNYPDVSIGSYPFFRQNRVGTSLVARGTDPARLDLVQQEICAAIRQKSAEPILE